MQAPMWWMLALIFLAGAFGGVGNALVTDNGFLLPKSEQAAGGATILRPGYLGNILVGAMAAVISWGLYGPISAVPIFAANAAIDPTAPPEKIGLTLASFVGAMLVGVGGARWLSSEVDKSLLRATAAAAAGKPSSPDASQQIAMAKPAEALKVATSM